VAAAAGIGFHIQALA